MKSKKPKPALQNLPIDQLIRGKYQSRHTFDQTQLEELATSIKATNGLLQPIVARKLPASDTYEIIAGERRWRAAQLAGLTEVSCLVGQYTDEEAMEACLIENISRVDLNPIEEAKAYQRMIDDFGYIHEEIAATVGKSRTKITNALRLLKLDEQTQNLLIQGDLSEGHGKVLSGVPKQHQYRLAEQCQKKGWSVRKLEQEAKKLAQPAIDVNASKDPNITALENTLAEQIGCNVKIDFSGSKGQLHIDFHNLEILQGLLEKVGIDNN